MLYISKIYLKIRWYSQGVSGTPMLLSSSAVSGFVPALKKRGFSFEHFLFRYEKDQAEMLYDTADLERLWESVCERVLADPNYLTELRIQYDEQYEKFVPLFARVRSEVLTCMQ